MDPATLSAMLVRLFHVSMQTPCYRALVDAFYRLPLTDGALFFPQSALEDAIGAGDQATRVAAVRDVATWAARCSTGPEPVLFAMAFAVVAQDALGDTAAGVSCLRRVVEAMGGVRAALALFPADQRAAWQEYLMHLSHANMPPLRAVAPGTPQHVERAPVALAPPPVRNHAGIKCPRSRAPVAPIPMRPLVLDAAPDVSPEPSDEELDLWTQDIMTVVRV